MLFLAVLRPFNFLPSNLPPPRIFQIIGQKNAYGGLFFLSHNTKLLGKSFAKQKTTHESHILSRCKSAVAENICFATVAKSLAMLLFEHISEENREVGVAFGQSKLVTNIGTLVVVP